MSDRGAGFAAAWQLSIACCVLGILAVSLSVLLGSLTFSESERAAATVGLVLSGALALDVGYGALAQVVNRAGRELIVSSGP